MQETQREELQGLPSREAVMGSPTNSAKKPQAAGTGLQGVGGAHVRQVSPGSDPADQETQPI